MISCAEVLPGGGLGPVRTCLERDYHFSYPMVFEHDGDVFMVPESALNGTVELYRATRFPHEWTLEKVLQHLDAATRPSGTRTVGGGSSRRSPIRPDLA